MMNLSGTPCFESLCIIAFTEWFVPSPTNFNCSKTAMFREPPCYRNWASQPFLTWYIGDGHFWVASVCFRAWFSFGTEFFSLLQPRDQFFFFFISVVHACASCRANKKVILPAAIGNWEINNGTAPAATDNGPYFEIACTRVPEQNVCVTSRSLCEPLSQLAAVVLIEDGVVLHYFGEGFILSSFFFFEKERNDNPTADTIDSGLWGDPGTAGSSLTKRLKARNANYLGLPESSHYHAIHQVCVFRKRTYVV